MKTDGLYGYLILLGVAFFPVVGFALDLVIEPRVQAGLIDYKFEQKSATRSDGDKDYGFKLIGEEIYNHSFSDRSFNVI